MRTKLTVVMVVFGLLFSFGGIVQGQGSACGALEDIAQSVVLIFRIDSAGQVLGSGTGVIVDPSGLIYTNRHVVAGGAHYLILTLNNLNRPPEIKYFASLYGALDPEGNVNGAYADFAILQISSHATYIQSENRLSSAAIVPGSLNLPTITPALNEPIQRGDTICVFGFPVTTSLDGLRTLNITGGAITSILDGTDDFADQPKYYYTDAEIAPGNSGGLAIKIGADGGIHYIGIPTLLVEGELGVLLPIATQLALAETLSLITRFDAAPAEPEIESESTCTPFQVPQPVVFNSNPWQETTRNGDVILFADGTCNPPRFVQYGYYPAPSPEGTRIAHGSWDGDSDIRIHDIEGNQLKHFDIPENQDQPSWSPDGSQIVFNSTENNQDRELWIMSANGDGSDRSQLTMTTANEWVYPSAFSPDGQFLYYEACGGEVGDDCDVMRMTMSSRAIDNLTQSNSGFDGRVSVSPDGTKLVFISIRNNQEDVYLMDTSNPSTVTQLTNDGWYEWGATWIDNNTILFNSARGADAINRLYMLDINTLQVQLFLDYPGAFRGAIVRR